MSFDDAEHEANTDALQAAIDVSPRWLVGDVLSELGGDPAHRNRDLARELLEYKGIDNPTKTQINSQMRNIQRWLNHENGVTGKQSSKPGKNAQGFLDKVGRNVQAGKNGFTVSISGDMEVNGYRRNRSVSAHIAGDKAVAFLNNPNWQDLASSYGVDSLHAFGDANIDISWH